jgi:hypothetical protein
MSKTCTVTRWRAVTPVAAPLNSQQQKKQKKFGDFLLLRIQRASEGAPGRVTAHRVLDI